eukprot:gnl/TRDRNA2_/TRDRNA2_36696_c1_seq1.p1 gnl/TRDRNA2_/TRDRNA2_36696_c1~~gnl/TRDRNA2_/TRDRNA2_36696_c1_seq1.p1  ORF type:complete len:344 (-),score=56.12 gnl/TRDRNA2_/TRDRNA2_36696_c1_seq1:6-1037(-)
MIEVIPVAHELDLVEARMYDHAETVDVFVIAEAAHNHRADRKGLHFNNTRARFAPFESRLFHVVEDCQEALDVIGDLRAQCVKKQALWVVHQQQRHCIFRKMMDAAALPTGILSGLERDDIVVHSDADEMVSADLLFHLRHCETKADAFPMSLTMKQLSANLRGGCEPKESSNHGTITLWGYVQQDKTINRWGYCATCIERKFTEVKSSGAHMTSFGSMASFDYKGFNFDEAGNFIPVVVDRLAYLPAARNPSILRRRQQLANDDPRLLVRFWEKRGEPRPPEPPAKDELYRCLVPWFIIEEPARFPFVYGAGSIEQVEGSRVAVKPDSPDTPPVPAVDVPSR